MALPRDLDLLQVHAGGLAGALQAQRFDDDVSYFCGIVFSPVAAHETAGAVEEKLTHHARRPLRLSPTFKGPQQLAGSEEGLRIPDRRGLRH
jgi:hypothetical protein